jgi:hypothetical protein
MSTFDTDFAAFEPSFQGVFGDTIAYHRGATSNMSITAQVSVSDHDITDSEGFQTVVRSRDFVVNVADLVINSVAITPRAGDRIKIVVGTETHTYTVMQLPDKDCYDWLDLIRTAYVIHTKLTDVT